MAEKREEREEPTEAFRVNDRRRVHLEDEAAGGAAEAEASAEGREAPRAEPGRPSEEEQRSARDLADEAARRGPKAPPPPVDFLTFVLSLGSSALVHLGEAPHPESGQPTVNLPMAKQTIDMICMLREKTKGNLDDDESRYLEALLHDLRLRFVDASRNHT